MRISVKIRKKRDREHLLLYYVDPITGREKSRSAETANRKEAERAAQRWEAELEQFHGADGCGWEMFRSRLMDERLAFKSRNTQAAYITALNAFEQRTGVKNLRQVTPTLVSTFAAGLQRDQYPHSTIKTYLTHLLAAFRWAKRMNLMRQVPEVELPSTGRQTHMRGRPITSREVAKMLRACRSRRQAAEWRQMIKLLWLSGLRLSEALELSWDRPPLTIDLDAKPYPLIVIEASGQKNRSDSAIPLTPDFAAWLAKVPRRQRTGYAVDVRNAAGKRYTVDKLSDEITEIGKAAGIVVAPARGRRKEKYASAHDLRRSFATRWAMRVRPMTLQRMMRHANIATTLKYYVGLSTADVGVELWSGLGASGPSGPRPAPDLDREQAQ